MATILDKFAGTVAGSKYSINDFLPVLAPKGDFQRISGLDVIINSYKTILLTAKGTYDHDPDFGCDLYRYVFEPCDSGTLQSIEVVITDQLLRYEDRAKLQSLNVYFLSNKKGFAVDVYVSYQEQQGRVYVIIDENMVPRSVLQ
jgi:phage baseplate assembly protein W